jgi:hypothetical protein
MAVAVAVDVVVAAAAVHLGDTCNQGDDGRNAPIAGGVVAALEGAVKGRAARRAALTSSVESNARRRSSGAFEYSGMHV